MKQQTNRIKQYLIIAIILIAMPSCNNDTQIKEFKNQIEALNVTLKSKDSTILSLKEQLGNGPDTRRAPKNIIQSDFAKEIYHLYDEREELINEVVGQDGDDKPFKATRSLFYDFNDLQQYIRYVKIKSRKARVKPSGFRFYFALYPDDYVRDGKNKKYAQRQTFFIAPTVRKKVGGKLVDLGYTLDNKFNVELLKDIIGFDSIRGKDGKLYQRAGFFNVNLSNLLEEENSLIANEVTGTPPMGEEQ
ncbi:hypothetical protein [uncultured Aquimarina sp.]|uniref:hypothetical protein n=1 Tax=uncultured Aquimarina sp. TaxID=575652 RepID=UPI00261BE659|nr:hypothetical protein [uncultured Aquimarina sp.]